MPIVNCWDPNCQATCSLTERQYKYHKEHGTRFFCAAGHECSYRPSEIDKLKTKVSRLEDEVKRYKRYWTKEENNWKCPFGGCYYTVGSKGSLVGHINREHNRTPKTRQLAADAGPDALNTTVH